MNYSMGRWLREYDEPCVSGIQDLTIQFKHDQIVEVDGDAGVIRFIDGV